MLTPIGNAPQLGNRAVSTSIKVEGWRAAIAIAMALVLLSVVNAAPAQWTVTNLHPDAAGKASSIASSTSGMQQAGYIYHPLPPGPCPSCETPPFACLWSGSAESWVDLHPAGAKSSIANGIFGTQQVGNVDGHASLWSGTAQSWVDLMPAGAIGSNAYGIFGTQQVGYAVIGGAVRASLWSGTAESWVDLHPEGATGSHASGTSGTQQVGDVQIGQGPGSTVYHASLWSGTAESWVDLNPAGATFSVASAISGTQQAGSARFANVNHAGVWSGTAQSWVDLHPAGATFSAAYGTSGTQQVGQADIGGISHASLWYGTAESWVDLNALLPAGFGHTQATSIWSDGSSTYIAGSSGSAALLWIIPALPCAPNIVNSAGSVYHVDVHDLIAVILNWGPCPAPPATCPANIVNSGTSVNRVDVDDLLAVITGWGACS